jgi:flavin-dependent thymidylate synthase
MSKVSIVTYTGASAENPMYYAARVLVFTKNTRLNMTPDEWEKFLYHTSIEDIKKELSYMATTIASALEFVDVIFLIQDVSRACAQQITRTRNASYQMSSQRIMNLSSATYHVPDSVKDKDAYNQFMRGAFEDYSAAVGSGETPEDARGLLPMNVHCNLIAKYNLRALVELLRGRDSLRVQGEYRDIARQMKALVLQIWPWSEVFFVPKNQQAITLIESVACELSGDQRMKLAKASDILKKA